MTSPSRRQLDTTLSGAILTQAAAVLSCLYGESNDCLIKIKFIWILCIYEYHVIYDQKYYVLTNTDDIAKENGEIHQ